MIKRTVVQARTVSRELEAAVADFKNLPEMNASARAKAMELIRDDVVLCASSVEGAVTAVMDRHQRIQQGKRKAMWIDCGPAWILMPGLGNDADHPPDYQNTFLHPMRIMNGFSFLHELGLVRIPTMVTADDN